MTVLIVSHECERKAQRRMKQLLVLSFWASYYYKMEVGLGQVRAAKCIFSDWEYRSRGSVECIDFFV